MKRVYIFINGILTRPGESRNWTGRAVTWTHLVSEPAKAEKVEYHCGPISRALGQKERANKLYVTSHFYSDWEQIIVGHSNGADVILSMMRDYPAFHVVSALHLVCAATNANFETNRLNFFLRTGRIGHVYVYVAGRDLALRLAQFKISQLFGYGTLGLHGPLRVENDVRERVHVIKTHPWTHYGHSDCWRDENFDRTMANFIV